ncbi:MAG: hypothetical protein IJ730_07515 [Alphaproteobacteria bacterium]|nr:hypothetical protein [Alphaproteobacteria bacterium]
MHRLLCADPTDQNAIKQLMNGKEADMIFTDAPQSDESFEKAIKNMISFSKDGSIHYICSDWKRMYEILLRLFFTTILMPPTKLFSNFIK